MGAHADPLPTDVPALQRMVAGLRAENAALHAENARLRDRVAVLEAEVADLRAKLDAVLRRSYGRRSERSKRARKADRDAVDGGPPKGRHDHGRTPLPAHLERREVVHDLPDAERPCPCCGAPRECIGTRSSEQLDCDPIHFFVRKTTRKTYACRACGPGAVPAERRITTAGDPPGPIPKGLCGPGLLAYVLTSKFADHLPLHRLAGIIARSGVRVAESTLGDWVRRAADRLGPVRALMHRRLLLCRVIHADDTRGRYAEPGRDPMPSGHFWVAVGDAAAPYAVFDFTRGYSADEGPVPFFEGYRGYLQADCLKQYEPLFAGGAVRHVACFAHARRKLLDAGEAGAPGVAFVRRLYAVERSLPPPDTAERIDQRQSIRQSRSVPILGELKAWLDAESKAALPKSPLGEAVGYLLNHWPAFERYAEEGYLSIDNNLSERTLRAVAVGRNNWKFVGSASAGERAAVHHTVVGTCRHLGVDPFAYLRDALPSLYALGEDPSDDHLAELLPDAWARRQPTTSATSTAA